MNVLPMKPLLRAIFFAASIIGAATFAEGLPGDNFRHAASEYDAKATDAVERATASDGKTVGRYLQLTTIYREMAGVKRRSALLADAERWEQITWDEYAALERRRDTIIDTLDGDPVGLSGPREPYEYAAVEYRQHARDARTHGARAKGAEQAIYRELATVFSQMAAIKDHAASAVRNGDNINWSRYEALSERQQQLNYMLEAGR